MVRAFSISIRGNLVAERWQMSPGAALGITLSSLQMQSNGVLCYAVYAYLIGPPHVNLRTHCPRSTCCCPGAGRKHCSQRPGRPVPHGSLLEPSSNSQSGCCGCADGGAVSQQSDVRGDCDLECISREGLPTRLIFAAPPAVEVCIRAFDIAVETDALRRPGSRSMASTRRDQGATSDVLR